MPTEVTFSRPNGSSGAFTVSETGQIIEWDQILAVAEHVPKDATWICKKTRQTSNPTDPNRFITPQPVVQEKQGEMQVSEVEYEPKFKALSEPFPSSVLGTLNKGGTRLTYLPVAEAIVRLNRVLGVTNWASEIISCQRDTTDAEWIVAHVRVYVRPLDRANEDASVSTWPYYEQYGGQKIKMMKDGSGPVDLGDEFKGAVSDALKKATQQIMIGLDIARKDEALRYESEMERAEENKPASPEALSSLKEAIATLSPDRQTDFKAQWKERGYGKLDALPERLYEEVEALLGGFLAEEATEKIKAAFPGTGEVNAESLALGGDEPF